MGSLQSLANKTPVIIKIATNLPTFIPRSPIHTKSSPTTTKKSSKHYSKMRSLSSYSSWRISKLLPNWETPNKKFTNILNRNSTNIKSNNLEPRMAKLLKNNKNTVHKPPATTTTQLNPKTNSTARQSHSSKCPNLIPIIRIQTYYSITRNTICVTCGSKSS